MYVISHIIVSVEMGQWEQAKEYIQRRCKSKPTQQAARLAQVACALVESGRADDAKRLIKMFEND